MILDLDAYANLKSDRQFTRRTRGSLPILTGVGHLLPEVCL